MCECLFVLQCRVCTVVAHMCWSMFSHTHTHVLELFACIFRGIYKMCALLCRLLVHNTCRNKTVTNWCECVYNVVQAGIFRSFQLELPATRTGAAQMATLSVASRARYCNNTSRSSRCMERLYTLTLTLLLVELLLRKRQRRRNGRTIDRVVGSKARPSLSLIIVQTAGSFH